MKKVITKLFITLSLLATLQANAQYCGSSQVGLGYGSCGIQSNYGFGDMNTYSCITRGQTDSLVIPFEVFQQFTVGSQTVTIYKL